MTGNEGESLLRTCLNEIDPSFEIADVLYYKTGNRKKASNYNRGDIVTTLNPDEIQTISNKVPFVVKCFYHMEIYVAWHSAVGIGTGKYCVYRSSLEDFEKNQELTYRVMNTGTRNIGKVYFFRGRDGINTFFADAAGIKKEETK